VSGAEPNPGSCHDLGLSSYPFHPGSNPPFIPLAEQSPCPFFSLSLKKEEVVSSDNLFQIINYKPN